MTIMRGANDERRNTPLGTLAAKGSNFDTTTYIGSLQSGIEYALSQNPDITIVLFTPIVGWIYADGQGDEGYAYKYDKANQPTVDGIVTEKWANAVKEVAALYGLTVCDLYNDCEMGYDNGVQDRIDYMNDPEPEDGNKLYSLHPNTAGYKLMAQAIIKTFKSLKTRPTRFDGTTCVTFGASNTWYDGNAYTWGKAKGEIAVGYQTYMREILGMNVINRGVSGITLPNNVAQQVKSAELLEVWKDVDYVTIKAGINEERRNTPMGTLMAKGSDFDTTTYIGSLQSAVEYILDKNPNITIMLLTTTNAWIYADGVGDEGYAYDYDKENQPTTDGRIPEKWADAMKQVAELYDLPVCDLYNQVKFDTASDREMYLNDPEPPENKLYSTHPTAEGYKIVADEIIKAFLALPLDK
jgi:lysophospholipase L1-like esterase